MSLSTKPEKQVQVQLSPCDPSTHIHPLLPQFCKKKLPIYMLISFKIPGLSLWHSRYSPPNDYFSTFICVLNKFLHSTTLSLLAYWENHLMPGPLIHVCSLLVPETHLQDQADLQPEPTHSRSDISQDCTVFQALELQAQHTAKNHLMD